MARPVYGGRPLLDAHAGDAAAERAVAGAGELAYTLFDEDKSSLVARVRRLDTGLAHVEEPRSLTRHLISNVLVRETDAPDEVIAESNFSVFQVHPPGPRVPLCRQPRGPAAPRRHRMEDREPQGVPGPAGLAPRHLHLLLGKSTGDRDWGSDETSTPSHRGDRDAAGSSGESLGLVHCARGSGRAGPAQEPAETRSMKPLRSRSCRIDSSTILVTS